MIGVRACAKHCVKGVEIEGQTCVAQTHTQARLLRNHTQMKRHYNGVIGCKKQVRKQTQRTKRYIQTKWNFHTFAHILDA